MKYNKIAMLAAAMAVTMASTMLTAQGAGKTEESYPMQLPKYPIKKIVKIEGKEADTTSYEYSAKSVTVHYTTKVTEYNGRHHTLTIELESNGTDRTNKTKIYFNKLGLVSKTNIKERSCQQSYCINKDEVKTFDYNSEGKIIGHSKVWSKGNLVYDEGQIIYSGDHNTYQVPLISHREKEEDERSDGYESKMIEQELLLPFQGASYSPANLPKMRMYRDRTVFYEWETDDANKTVTCKEYDRIDNMFDDWGDRKATRTLIYYF